MANSPPPLSHRRGFTLIELLVVMIVIGILIAILVPGLQAAREAARRASCANNMRQIGMAVHNHEAAKGYYPASWLSTDVAVGSDNLDGWSFHGQLLPYLEQRTIANEIDFALSYNLAPDVVTADGVATKLSALRVPTYLCPSEVRDEVRFEDGEPKHHPINYGANLGTWFVWDPASKQGGPGSFYPDSKLTGAKFLDGLSFTLAAAEVKGWNPYYRNAGGQTVPTMPVTPGEMCSMGGDFKSSSGHTEWVDGRGHQTGFTTTFRPNAKVLCTVGPDTFDIDWTNWQEGKGLAKVTPDLNPTYAAVTARSYHGGMVNVLLMDGSVRSMNDDVELGVWQAISTRDGGELMPEDFNKR